MNPNLLISRSPIPCGQMHAYAQDMALACIEYTYMGVYSE